MEIKEILNLQDLAEAISHIEEVGHFTFDLETESLFFKDEIFVLCMGWSDLVYFIPFESINDFRKRPKPVKIKKSKKKKTKPQSLQFALFSTDEVTKKIEGLVEQKPVETPVQTAEIKPAEIPTKFVTFDDCSYQLSCLFENPDILKTAHNFKFDAKFLIYRGINIEGWYFDTQLAAWQIKENRLNYSLKHLYAEEFETTTKTFKETVKGREFYEMSYEEIREYSCNDIIYTDALKSVYEAEIMDGNDQQEFFETQMMRVSRTLANMEFGGALIDSEYAQSFVDENKSLIEVEMDQINQICLEKGIDVDGMNWNSNQQKVKLFYDDLGRTTFKKKKSVDKNDLERWENEGCEISKHLRESNRIRDLVKFVDGDKNKGLLNLVQDDGRIYHTLNQHRTRMHRLSGTDPNTQNFPRQGGAVRECFIAPEGHHLLIADYGQIELRCFAHYSQDKSMLEAFMGESKKDLHEITRQAVFGEVEKGSAQAIEQRTIAKNINFGLWYGAGDKKIAEMMGVNSIQGASVMKKVFNQYSENVDWIDRLKKFCVKNKWVGNCYGGKRRFHHVDFSSVGKGVREFILREAVHFTVSSTAACIIKARMNLIDEYLPEVQMVLQVHDELLMYIPDGFDPKPVIDIMEQPDDIFTIPLTVDYEIKDRWSK